MRISLDSIPVTFGHNNTVTKKQLILVDQKKGRIATVNYAWLKKGMKVTPHVHVDGEEYYFFLSGRGNMLVGDDWSVVIKNDFIIVPKNMSHSLSNNNDEDLIFLTIRTVED